MLELDTTVGGIVRTKAIVHTLGQQLDSRLARLLTALGQSEHLQGSLRAVKALTGSWRDEPISAGPWWPSDITDDHSPFEFSLAFDGNSEVLRVLTEPQDPRLPSLRASWQIAAGIHEELASKWGSGFAGYDKVAPLFEPTQNDQASFSIWHSAVLGSYEKTEFKVYLNPAVHGAADANRVVSEALARLGLGRAWEELAKCALSRVGLDQAIYFSLDLADVSDARAKVYVVHRMATAKDLARALAPCPGFVGSDIDRWCRHLMSGCGPFLDRPPITCFALRLGGLDLHTTTLHFPARCYVPDDFEIARRVCTLLRFPQRVSYMRALTEFAERPLQSGPGIQTYASLRPSPGRESVTVYLAPQVYSSHALREADRTEGFFSGSQPAPQAQGYAL